MSADADHDLKGLPDPVSRYFRRVLAERQRPIRIVRMEQSGTLRADLRRERWMPFRATEIVEPISRRFSWDATVRVLPRFHLRVRDSYVDGVGAGRVQLMSAVTLAADSGKPELNAASLHRYLAEAVWYPTALLPSAGVQWRTMDARKAMATLTDSGVTVDLEFRFNDADEVVSVYGQRWSRAGTKYELRPWEGRFAAYRRHRRVLVPTHGEVGWYVDGRLEIVWIGEVSSIEYAFDGTGG